MQKLIPLTLAILHDVGTDMDGVVDVFRAVRRSHCRR